MSINQSRIEDDNPYQRTLDLRNQLVNHFNEVELKYICDELGLDYENIPHNTKPELARGILKFTAAEGLYGRFLSILRRNLPNIEWPDHFIFPSGSLDYEDKPTPVIQFGFPTANGLMQSMTISIDPVPMQPDYDARVEQERMRLGIGSTGVKEPDSESDAFLQDEMVKWVTGLTRQRKDYLAYLSDYKHYLWQHYLHNINRARVRKVAIAVKNVGNATAENVLIQLKVPNEVQFANVLLKEDPLYALAFFHEAPPTPLTPPGPYGPIYRSRFADILERSIPDSSEYERVVVQESDSTPIRLEKRADWTEIEFKVSQLIHGYRAASLDIPAFLVAQEAEGKLLSIDYAIGSSSMPATVSGQLSLSVSCPVP